MFKKAKNENDIEALKEEVKKYHEHIGVINDKDDFMIYVQKQMNKLSKKIK